MTVQTAEASTPTAEAALATAAAYQAEQAAETQRLVAAVLVLWASLDAKQAWPSWRLGRIGTEIFVLLAALMELVARDANGYVRQVLNDQNVRYTGPDINPLAFAGQASDGRELETLLMGAVVKLRQAQRRGLSDAQAKMAGRNFLEVVVNTQVRDAARAAESASLVVSDGVDKTTGRAVQVGYVRMLTPPSCGRCAVLAGKFYKWNKGFERHPNCDCRHIPTTVVGSNEILTDPYAYFQSLSEAEQDRYFGGPQAQAIRDGADINQVVNSQRTKGSMFVADDGGRYTNEGTTKRGYARGVAGNVPRPTVWQIYRDAGGDKDEAKRLLTLFGYSLPAST